MNRTERREIIQSAGARRALAQRRKILVYVSVAIMALIVIVAVVLATNKSAVPVGASHADGRAALTVGQKAPEFAVSTTAGPFDLATAAGKPVLLEVFASWCPHCQREVPALDRIAATYKAKARVVAVAGSPFGIDQSAPESQADVVAFVEKYHATYPVAFDPNLDVAKKYLQGGFPTVVLIGADGTVQAIRDGEIPAGDLTKALDLSIAGKKPDPKLGAKT